MKKNKVVLILFTLTVINIITEGFWISGIKEKMELLVEKKENILKLENSLYNSASLDAVVLKLEGELSARQSSGGSCRDQNTLKMTEEVLLLLEQNGIRVISYRLEGEENREELALSGEGNPGSVLELIYEISSSEKRFRINFLTVDAQLPGKPAFLVIRIRYA